MLLLFILSLASDPQAKKSDIKTAESSATSPDKMICRRFTETGSLVSSYKTCKTRREWEMERENIRASGPGVESCRNAAIGGPC